MFSLVIQVLAGCNLHRADESTQLGLRQVHSQPLHTCGLDRVESYGDSPIHDITVKQPLSVLNETHIQFHCFTVDFTASVHMENSNDVANAKWQMLWCQSVIVPTSAVGVQK